MSLTNPNLVYTILNEKITGKRMNPTRAATFLDDFFKKKDKLKILRSIKGSSARGKGDIKLGADTIRVLLIDELDALVTKK